MDKISIDAVGSKIWEAVRAVQARGIQVEPLGGYQAQQGESVCLLGAILVASSTECEPNSLYVVPAVAATLGISHAEVTDLEAGFEEWSPRGVPYETLGRHFREQLAATSTSGV